MDKMDKKQKQSGQKESIWTDLDNLQKLCKTLKNWTFRQNQQN